MADNTTINSAGTVGSLVNSLQYPQEQKKQANEIGKEEFLKMLVTQLKNQDPLDPMSNDDFAVDLAQFSQLEQLIEIKKSLSGGSDLGSLASYLGHEVVLAADQVTVAGGDGGSISFDLAADAMSVQVDLLDSNGSVADSVQLGAMNQGRRNAALSDLHATDGEYTARITAVGTDGRTFQADATVGGVVTGFVPGDQPMLIVNGREVSPADIREVRMASADDAEGSVNG